MGAGHLVLLYIYNSLRYINTRFQIPLAAVQNIVLQFNLCMMHKSSKLLKNDEAAAADDELLDSNSKGSRNNATDTSTKNNEKGTATADYSTVEDLLSIDDFITQIENVNTNLSIDIIDPTVSSTFLPVDHTSLIEENAITKIVDNIQEKSIAGSNGLIFPTNINRVSSSDNLKGIDIDDEVSEPTNMNHKNNDSTAPLAETSFVLMETNSTVQTKNQIDTTPNASSLKAIQNKNGTATTPTAKCKSTKTSKAGNKHFPQFIKLYCVKCGEGPWNSKYYTNAKCPTCENKAWLRCSKCKQESDRYESMVYHLKTKCAPNNVKYKCSQCDYHTFLRYSFKYHVKTHEPPNNLMCSDCGVGAFKTDKSLRDHKRYYCPNRKIERNLRCASCCKGYKNETFLRKHEKKCFDARGLKKPSSDETQSG